MSVVYRILCRGYTHLLKYIYLYLYTCYDQTRGPTSYVPTADPRVCIVESLGKERGLNSRERVR